MTMATRRMKAIERRERWLYRLPSGDYGPVSTEDLLEILAQRKIDLSTLVQRTSDGKWDPAGAHALLRDHYERCASRWEAEELHAAADAKIRSMHRRRHAGRGLWTVIIVGMLVAAGVATWIVWRITQAEPLGMAQLYRVPPVERLPDPPVARVAEARMTLSAGTKIARLREMETYDTAGIKVGDGAVKAAPVKMTFDADGNVAGLDAASLNRVMENARSRLAACAKDLAVADRAFTGTSVGFTVAPSALTDITVGQEAASKPAFKACVKAALRRVSVPAFTGSPRRVNVPLRVAR